ncbi:EAL domain-containing protein [Halopseudomonas sp.]|uniref:EAL domain-containing protein n=1 Tax=Halopseudomonas sp. TaxID=2901191 RepID=UPI00356282E1
MNTSVKPPGSMPGQRLIMVVLSLLVVLFITGMLLMSRLNLDFAQQTLSDLRQRQIIDTFQANLDRINAHHQKMEQNTVGLARTGELFHRLGPNQNGNSASLERMLREGLNDFPDAHGSGIWYEPGAFDDEPVGVLAYRQGSDIRATRATSDFVNRGWYRRLVDNLDDAGQATQPRRFYWTSAYFKRRIENVVVSLSTTMRDSGGRSIGVVSTDWLADDIIRLISGVEITPGTFSFLLDSENRNLSSLSQANDVERAQQLMDAVSAAQLQLSIPLQTVGSPSGAAAAMEQRTLEVAGERFALFYSETQAGMVFGIGVPQAEIDAVLLPMRASNLRIVALIGSILIVLSALILYMIAGTLRQLRNLYTDPLTRLPNRERLLVDVRRRPSASLVLLNIDGFKEINNFYGHQCGDHVIVTLSTQMLAYLHKQPLSRSGRLYRMPGDELAIWRPGQDDESQLVRLADDLQALVAAIRIQWKDHELTLHVSMGLASTRSPRGDSIACEDLLPSASIALEHARMKQAGYMLYDPADRARENYEHNIVWANKLKAALDENRLVPFFQPIMNIASGRIEKFECLVRMLDDLGEPISPSMFLPIARKIRLYRSVTRRMIDMSLQWFASNDYEFSLNLSSEDLLDLDLHEFIVERLQDRSLAERVIFEVLESESIENYEPVRLFIDRVKVLGCRIAIDDFGTGYSNFEHLLRLNVDIIKIDGSLIRQLDTDANAVSLTRGIVQFARELKLQTVAEFVHSPSILAQVRLLGIDFAQGACIGMPANALITDVLLADTATNKPQDTSSSTAV